MKLLKVIYVILLMLIVIGITCIIYDNNLYHKKGNKELIKKYESAKKLYLYFWEQVPSFDITKFEVTTSIGT